MKRLLNFGVSNPLTLGMAHPVADRLETLGRARPTTWRSRCVALSAMSVIALVSAPFSVASDHPDHDADAQVKTLHKFTSHIDGKKGQSYEIVTEDGVRKAYRVFEDGKRKKVGLKRQVDGSFQMTYDDGQVIDLPNLDMDAIAGLKGLSGLEGLKGLKVLKSLDSLDAFKGLDGIGLSGEDVQVFTFDGSDFEFSDHVDLLDKIPEEIRGMIRSKDGSKIIKIIRNGATAEWLNEAGEYGEAFELADTIVGTRFEFSRSSDPLATAQRQLEQTRLQLESLSKDEDVSFDLQNALRDIENAQKSIEEAENRLLSLDE